MIFASGTSEGNVQVPIESTDCFCFFSAPGAVEVPREAFWISVLTSLKMKKNVLILDRPLDCAPFVLSERWVVGEHFLWLAPRSFSTIFEAILGKTMNYSDLRHFLLTHK